MTGVLLIARPTRLTRTLCRCLLAREELVEALWLHPAISPAGAEIPLSAATAASRIERALHGLGMRNGWNGCVVFLDDGLHPFADVSRELWEGIVRSTGCVADKLYLHCPRFSVCDLASENIETLARASGVSLAPALALAQRIMGWGPSAQILTLPDLWDEAVGFLTGGVVVRRLRRLQSALAWLERRGASCARQTRVLLSPAAGAEDRTVADWSLHLNWLAARCLGQTTESAPAARWSAGYLLEREFKSWLAEVDPLCAVAPLAKAESFIAGRLVSCNRQPAPGAIVRSRHVQIAPDPELRADIERIRLEASYLADGAFTGPRVISATAEAQRRPILEAMTDLAAELAGLPWPAGEARLTTVGAGRDVLVLSPPGVSPYFLAPLVAQLKKTCRVHLWTPAHSDHQRAGFAAATDGRQMVEDLAKLVGLIGGRPVHLVAWCGAARVAARLICRLPELATHVTLIAPDLGTDLWGTGKSTVHLYRAYLDRPHRVSRHLHTLRRLVERGEVVGLGSTDDAEHASDDAFCQAFAQPDKALRPLIAQLLDPGPGLMNYATYVVEDLFGPARQQYREAAFAFAAVPCQVLVAVSDDMIRATSLARRFADLGATAKTFAYAGHYFIAEEAEAIGSAVLAFDRLTIPAATPADDRLAQRWRTRPPMPAKPMSEGDRDGMRDGD